MCVRAVCLVCGILHVCVEDAVGHVLIVRKAENELDVSVHARGLRHCIVRDLRSELLGFGGAKDHRHFAVGVTFARQPERGLLDRNGRSFASDASLEARDHSPLQPFKLLSEESAMHGLQLLKERHWVLVWHGLACFSGCDQDSAWFFRTTFFEQMNFVYAPPRGRGRPRKDIVPGVQRTIAKPVQPVQAVQPRGCTQPYQELGRHPTFFWTPLPQADPSVELELRDARVARERREREEREERAAAEAKNRAEFEAQAERLAAKEAARQEAARIARETEQARIAAEAKKKEIEEAPMKYANQLKSSFDSAGLKPQISYVNIHGHWEDVCAPRPVVQSKPPPKERVSYIGQKWVQGPSEKYQLAEGEWELVDVRMYRYK